MPIFADQPYFEYNCVKTENKTAKENDSWLTKKN